MNAKELAVAVQGMRAAAQMEVVAYATRTAPRVKPGDLLAIVNALGEISVDEARTAIDRLAFGRKRETDGRESRQTGDSGFDR